MKKIFVGLTVFQIVKSLAGIAIVFLLMFCMFGSNPVSNIQEKHEAFETQYEYNKSLMNAASERQNTAIYLDAYGNVVD